MKDSVRGKMTDKDLEERKEQNLQDSDFVSERIKQRPLNKKKLARRTFITALMAVIFAMVACIVFTFLQPVISNWLYPEEEPEIITFPEETVEILPEDMLTDEEEEQKEKEQEQQMVVGPILEQTEGFVDQQLSQMLANLEIGVDDYQSIYDSIYQVAEQSLNFMVTVTGVTKDLDWFNNVYENEGLESGLIIGNNGRQLLILTKTAAVENAETIIVTFVDGKQSTAEIKQSDPNTKLTVLAIPLNVLSSATKESIETARLGSSNLLNLVGTPVIAIGGPMGTSGSIGYGMITSSSKTLNMVDANYKLISTDIYGSQKASGVLINLKGQVIGIIDNSYNDSDMKNLVSAIGITELKQIFEKLSNGQEVAYLGIEGADVSAAIHNELRVPFGAYVKSIEMNSPAMEEGIQSGDVIVSFNGANITQMADLTKELYKVTPETEVDVVVQRQGQNEYVAMELTLILGVME